MSAKVCAAAAASLSMIAAGAPLAAPVSTDAGLIEGSSEHGVHVFRGVPFAAPPVGELRWRAPQPAPHWSGVRRADTFGASCVQDGRPNPKFGGPSPPFSEDCLYLNVWTPAMTSRDALPVMVWIHGGGFIVGSATMPLYSGDELVKHGVILVSVAYRLGSPGFLALPELSAESPRRVSGNYGLLDQIAGLEWVQRNISAFGGDPRRVTIFGESSGGISVSMLAASPRAKGLFARVIAQSGGSFGPARQPPVPGENMQSLADAERTGTAYAKRLGANSVDELRKLPTEALQRASSGLGQFWPSIDGWLILDDQYKLYQIGRYNKTPILIGTNSNEGALFGPEGTAESFADAVRARFGPYAEELLKLYPATESGWRQSSMDLTRDAGFGWHSWTWAQLQTHTGTSKAFLYYFDQQPPRADGSPYRDARGAVHGEEIIYVFEHLDQRPLPWTGEDRAISRAMATYWTNFAKQGDPNGPGMPHWAAYDDAKRPVMVFHGVPQPGTVANLERLKALDGYFAWRRTSEGIAWATGHSH